MKKATQIPYLIIFLSLFLQSLQAQELGIFDVLSHKDILKARLKTNITALKTNKKLTEALEGTFSYQTDGKEQKDIPVMVEMRGKFRRKICEMPPLKIKFSKEYLKKEGFDPTHSSLKLVVHCKEDPLYKDLLLREYLAYKMYNILTGKSLRVQLLELTYIDAAANNEEMTMYAFLLEDADQMAERLGGEICECHGTPKDSIAVSDVYNMAVFEYMIGNTDWSITMLRNIKIVSDQKSRMRIIVPYDFDFSGMVHAPYATAEVNLHLRHNRDRSLMRQDLPFYDMHKTVEHFQKKKKIMYNYINEFKLLDDDAKEDIIAYFDTFYKHIEEHPNDWYEAPFYYEKKR